MKRREFLRFMGSATGVAASAPALGQQQERVVPYLIPPEDGILPGRAHYAKTTCTECPAGCGLDVKIIDGKAVKLEGNRDHPINGGGLCIRGQAGLSRLYHPRRIKQPLLRGGEKMKPATWREALVELNATLGGSTQGEGWHYFLSSRTGGTISSLIDNFCIERGLERLPEFEPLHHGTLKETYLSFFGQRALPRYRIDKADVLLTFGADIVDTFISPAEFNRHVSQGRGSGLYWFHLESHLSLSGCRADSRLAVRPGSDVLLLTYLLRNLPLKQNLPVHLVTSIPAVSKAELLKRTGLSESELSAIIERLRNASHPLVMVGDSFTCREDGAVLLKLATLLQIGLSNVNDMLDFSSAVNDDRVGTMTDFDRLIKWLRADHVDTLVVFNVPALPGSPAWLKEFRKAGYLVTVSDMHSELTDASDMVLPLAHSLESWGDHEPNIDIRSLIQPVQKPLGDSKSDGDLLLYLSGKKESYQKLLLEQWRGYGDDWINRGFRLEANDIGVPLEADLGNTGFDEPININIPPSAGNGNIIFVPTVRTFDGRSATLDLLKEIPDPITSISYGSWAQMSNDLFIRIELAPGDEVEFKTAAGSITHPVVSVTGLAASTVVLPLDQIWQLKHPFSSKNGELAALQPLLGIRKTGRRFPVPALANSKETGSRNLVPGESSHHLPEKGTLYPEPQHEGVRWVMMLDLDKCTGCSACVAACYIENNIPLTGEAQHLKGREMSWLRIELYYNGRNRPRFVPVMCQHCDYAPCETVCPVYATYHNREGLNAQVYNRCVGTRYCSNNCPYKTRRFNWFDNRKAMPLYSAFNPDVSRRPPGVMEKCTFCWQRLRGAVDRSANYPADGGTVIQPACAQSCPSGAVLFGNLLDPESAVASALQSSDTHRLLEELGTGPAVYYVSKEKPSHE